MTSAVHHRIHVQRTRTVMSYVMRLHNRVFTTCGVAAIKCTSVVVKLEPVQL